MNPRAEFLSALFRVLDEKSVPYCVQRNYQNIYAESSSDVDLAVEPDQLGSFNECLMQAAAGSNYRLVHTARYVNYSYVFLRAEDAHTWSFLRLDVETEIRWRCFPILSAEAVVGLRRKQDGFYIPHPRHESVILFGAALWRGHLSNRYREQLARLQLQLNNAEELRRTFRSVFGSVGDTLADLQAGLIPSIAAEHPLPSTLRSAATEDGSDGRGINGEGSIWRAARRSLMVNAFRDPPNRRALLHYLWNDLLRLWNRLRRPAGISLFYASKSKGSRSLEELSEGFEPLFPLAKSNMKSVALSAPLNAENPPLARVRTLFSGGLFLRYYQLGPDADIKTLLSKCAGYIFPSHNFICVEISDSEIYLAHPDSGFMAELSPPVPLSHRLGEGSRVSVFPVQRIIEFVSKVLEERNATEDFAGKRGRFVVLVGLDGSGKTTVARKLCSLPVVERRFSKIRYYHWLPGVRSRHSFPLPDSRPTPRQPGLESNFWNSFLSIARLFKNVILANLAYWLRLRSLLRNNTLILVDRYHYNYFIDPASVKYSGPASLLDRVQRFFPKPDLVVILKARTEVLRERKQELSEAEILQQTQLLDRLQFAARKTIRVDTCVPALEVARSVMDQILNLDDELAR